MSGMLIFCIAEEAKPFVRKMLSIKWDGLNVFHLVVSRAPPSGGPLKEDDNLKQDLEENETFETDFIGASTQDCQKWALEKYKVCSFIGQDLIGVVDERSAEDGTILFQDYSNGVPLEFGKYGILPPASNTWYDFRIDYHKAIQAYVALGGDDFEALYPVYYGNRERITDEHGVIDVDEAERLMRGDEPDILNWAPPRDDVSLASQL